ncbi:MAG: tRNA1(Val) (adenine(37)-N6)-methyltransferase [Bauldia sp.]
MSLAVNAEDYSADAFLGGRVSILQPKRGHHRSGLEAVLLAAALPVGLEGVIVDLGAGAGVAGLCAASLRPAASVVLVEREAALVAVARTTLARAENAALAERVAIAEVDVAAPEAARIAAGIPRGEAAAVLTNPPFHDNRSVRVSPAAARAAAHVLPDGLEPWFRTAASALRPQGLLVAVTLASAVAEALDVLGRRFGDVVLLPIHPRAEEPAHRLLLGARKGRRGSPTILPGLVLHDGPGNAFAPNVEAILRGVADLSEAHPPWRHAVGGAI